MNFETYSALVKTKNEKQEKLKELHEAAKPLLDFVSGLTTSNRVEFVPKSEYFEWPLGEFDTSDRRRTAYAQFRFDTRSVDGFPTMDAFATALREYRDALSEAVAAYKLLDPDVRDQLKASSRFHSLKTEPYYG